MISAHAPGRTNLIGEHTDTTGGWCLPMAIELGTTVSGERVGTVVRLASDAFAEPAVVPIDIADPSTVHGWARYVTGVVGELRPSVGFVGTVRSSVPVGAGLSSSAALEVAVALALGFEGSTLELAQLCQRAERAASGVPCGIMDQLASAGGVEGHALLLDTGELTVSPVALPPGAQVLAVHSGQDRTLVGSAYAERHATLAAAEREVGPLRHASLADVTAIRDEVVRRRARHVVSENARVHAAAEAMASGDLRALGALLLESHVSLRDDFEVSTPVLDELVRTLTGTPGIVGARLTGAGFGGCAVAIGEPGARVDLPQRSWRLVPAAGARVNEVGGSADG